MNEKEINKELNKLSNKVSELKRKRIMLNAKVRFKEHEPKYAEMYNEILEADKYLKSFTKKVSDVMNDKRTKYSADGMCCIGKYSVSVSLKHGWYWIITIRDMSGESLFGDIITSVIYDTHTKDKKKHKIPSTLSKAIELYDINTPDKLEALYHAIDSWDILKEDLYEGELGIYEYIKNTLSVYEGNLNRDLRYVEEQLSS